jgi:hypothetical protein
MERYILDTSAISQMLELCKSGRARKIARLWYVNQMSIKDIEIHIGYAESVIVSEIMLIIKNIIVNMSPKICGQCGETFYRFEKDVRICPNCKEKNKKDRLEQQREIYKCEKPKQNSKPKRKFKYKSLLQIEKERAKYNKNNGTLLSYGQYVSMMGE